MSGEVFTLLKWMEAVEPYFQAHPWLVIQKGWALTMAGLVVGLITVLVPPFGGELSLTLLLYFKSPNTRLAIAVGAITAGRGGCLVLGVRTARTT